jgi:membrane protease YdiL (CAAX protease family)
VDRSEPLGAASVLGVLVLLIGWIVQGGAEEILARGYLLPVVGSRYGTLLGIFVSSLVFAIWHLLNPNLSLLAVINLFLYGIFAAFYALYEGGLWGVCAFHSVWNWVQGNFYGFEVSGAAFGGSSLLKLQESGPDWFTGGKFGPEGGLAVTLVLVAGCLWLLWASHRPGSHAMRE